MGVLDQIQQMKSQGYDDNQIVGTLQQQGYNPKDINDALGQMQIKNAIAGEQEMQQEGYDPMMPSQPQQDYSQGNYQASTQEMGYDQGETGIPQPGEQPQDYSQPYTGQMQGYPPQDQYSAYASQGTTDTDTIIEIAEQVFTEKTREMQKKLSELNEFKQISEIKIESISHRLEAIEKTINALQVAILERVGDYAQGIESIKKEMSMMQDSFGKMSNTLHEKKIPSTTKPTKKNPVSKK